MGLPLASWARAFHFHPQPIESGADIGRPEIAIAVRVSVILLPIVVVNGSSTPQH
jgi:hypothetical protein